MVGGKLSTCALSMECQLAIYLTWQMMNSKNYGTKNMNYFKYSSDKLCKDSLNSGGQQFHQYQQNGRPPLTPSININVRDYWFMSILSYF